MLHLLLATLLAAVTDSTVVKSISDHLLNGVESGLYFACVIAAYIGYLVFFVWTIQFRDPNTKHSPVAWDWGYFWSMNALPLVRDAITLPIVILFYPQLLDVILTALSKIDVVPDWATVIFDKYNTTTVFTSAGVGFLFKIGVRKLRRWKYNKRRKQSNPGFDTNP